MSDVYETRFWRVGRYRWRWETRCSVNGEWKDLTPRGTWTDPDLNYAWSEKRAWRAADRCVKRHMAARVIQLREEAAAWERVD